MRSRWRRWYSSTCCIRTSGSGVRRGRSSSDFCRSASSITRRSRSLHLLCCSWPARDACRAGRRGSRRMIPALVVFAYLAVVLYIGIFAFRTSRRNSAEDYFLAGRSLGPDRVSAVAVRHEHDGVLHPRRVRPCLRQRHRHVRPDGVVICAGHSRVPVRDRHAPVGARQAQPLHDAGADVPRSMGVPPHRHGHLLRAGGAARALHHHRGDGRRHRAARDHQRLRVLRGRRRHRLVGRDGVRVSRRHARNRVGERAADDAVPAVRHDRRVRHRRRHGRIPRSDGSAARLAGDVAAADARADFAAVLLQLHVHPALVDRLSAHLHLLPDRARRAVLPQDDRALSDLHAVHLAALGVPRRRRESGDCRSRPFRRSSRRGRSSRRQAPR